MPGEQPEPVATPVADHLNEHRESGAQSSRPRRAWTRGERRAHAEPAFRPYVDNRHTSTLPYPEPGSAQVGLDEACQVPAPRRAWLLFAMTGLLSAVVVVVCWARLSVRADPGATDPSRWGGLLPAQPAGIDGKALLLALLLIGLTGLAASYWQIQRLLAGPDGQFRRRWAALVAAAWALPFVLGPPVGSRDAYAYAAQGELARQGLDPVRIPVRALGPGPLLAAVDPRWRDSVPPYGGLGVLTERFAATIGHLTGSGAAGSPVASIITLKLVSALAVGVLAVLAGLIGARLGAGGTRCAFLAAANPLILLHLVGGAHLDALAVLLVVGAVAAFLIGTRQSRWAWIGLLVGLAIAVKITMVVLLVWLLLQARDSLRRCALLLSGTVLAFAVVTIASGSGFGWLHALGTPGQVRTGAALSDQLSRLAGGGLSAFRLGIEALGVLIAVAILLRTSRPRSGSAATERYAVWGLAVAFVVIGLSGPVFYPWYLAPGVVLLGCSGGRSVLAAGLLSLLAFITTLPTLAPLTAAFPAAGPLLLLACLLVLPVAAGATVPLGRRQTSVIARTAATTSSTLRDSNTRAAATRPETKSL